MPWKGVLSNLEHLHDEATACKSSVPNGLAMALDAAVSSLRPFASAAHLSAKLGAVDETTMATGMPARVHVLLSPLGVTSDTRFEFELAAGSTVAAAQRAMDRPPTLPFRRLVLLERRGDCLLRLSDSESAETATHVLVHSGLEPSESDRSFSLLQGQQLLRDFADAFASPKFQGRYAIADRLGRSQLALEMQKPLLVKYGFEASSYGLLEMAEAFDRLPWDLEIYRWSNIVSAKLCQDPVFFELRKTR